MCGICGYKILNEAHGNEDGCHKETITRMTKSLSKRGPDQSGVFISDKTCLGHTRLSIIDLASGKQPIHNEDESIWIVYNGECYNFRNLREELISRRHQFYTTSDTEVLVHLYEEEGAEFVRKIDGMFALCIYNERDGSILLAKDRFGKKPLFYSKTNGYFVFASEIKALLQHPAITRRIDEEALRKYLFYGFVPSPNTIFEGISKLEAGSYLTLENGEIHTKRYWDLNFSDKSRLPLSKTIEAVDGLLRKAVEKRLVSDVPLGVFLSGGIDSSLVVSYMKEIMGPENVRAFSIGFEESKYDESKYAKIVADHLGISHHLRILSQEECLNVINDIFAYLDEPISDPSIIPTYLLSGYTKEDVSVALSGDGGDELFLGYPKYMANRVLSNSFVKNAFVNTMAHRMSNHAINAMPSCMIPNKAKKFFDGLRYPEHIRNQVWISNFSENMIENLLDDSISGHADKNSRCMNSAHSSLYSDIEKHHNRVSSCNFVDESSYLDIKLTMQDMYLVKVDRASMAHSLEVRSPFLDKDLAEFACRIRVRDKFHGNQLKGILKKIAEKRIPKEVIYRKKMGFGIPVSRWIRGALREDVMRLLSEERLHQQGIFNPAYVQRIVSQHMSGREDNSMMIWSLYVFQKWHNAWMQDMNEQRMVKYDRF